MAELGKLESAVMDVLWRAANPLLVRDVLDAVTADRALAYTTVLTVLDNLHRKGWVVRDKDGKAYRYRAAGTREEITARTVRRVIETSAHPDLVLLHFARSASDHELHILRRVIDERESDA
ncbi:Predicted transcriptional regulator [Micromonospora sediminicola]|uniref:Predicted transcriptional regulator n=1 Tax=Micromonospora sediminicola TaxID=946078 RepID=A0A1A9BE51_9ACTN|nr:MULTISPECIES: BlaI/MecI/CopY family transcriptional regulator [Micromonospora]PGH45351.1 penicillinase repressor [Micromonospora sp. WMMA1996]SBT67244.1 Predicted transcriptional regulator [Micromonospora sediminicola]